MDGEGPAVYSSETGTHWYCSDLRAEGSVWKYLTKQDMMYRVIVMNNNGTQHNEVVEAPDYYSLGRALDKCEIKSFTVTLA